jgi:hypothetical protein
VADSLHHTQASIAHGDKPVLCGECSYEGIGGSSWQDVQRLLFWSHMMIGAAGHTYGTMAISTFSSYDDPYRPPSRAASQHWQDALAYHGAAQVGLGKRLLERYRWWELRPAPDAIEPHASDDNWYLPFAAALPDGSVLVYVPGIGMAPRASTEDYIRAKKSLKGLTPHRRYRATFVSVRTGEEEPTVLFETDDGRIALSDLTGPDTRFETPTWEDWLLVVRPDESVSSVSSKAWS